MQLSYGATFNNHVNANYPDILSIKKLKSVIIWQRYGHKFGGAFLMAHSV